MKNLLSLFLLFIVIGCSTDSVQTETTSYITDSDFNIQVVSWESWGDITNDGVTQNVLLDKGTGGNVKFIKSTGVVIVAGVDNETANSSKEGMLVFNNYWGSNPKTINFTIGGKYTINYDSRKDSQSGKYEVSTLTAYYTKL